MGLEEFGLFNSGPSNRDATESVLAGDSLYLELKAKIEAGDPGFERGDKFPTRAMLCAEYGISRGSAVNVFDRLIAERYIEPINPICTRVGFRIR